MIKEYFVELWNSVTENMTFIGKITLAVPIYIICLLIIPVLLLVFGIVFIFITFGKLLKLNNVLKSIKNIFFKD